MLSTIPLKEFQSNDDASAAVWYMKPEWFRAGINGAKPNPQNLAATHVLLGHLNLKDPEAVFGIMQGENWSPNGEANEFILNKGLGHTSMSVGDVVVIDGKAFMVNFVGFLPL